MSKHPGHDTLVAAPERADRATGVKSYVPVDLAIATAQSARALRRRSYVLSALGISSTLVHLASKVPRTAPSSPACAAPCAM